MKISFNTNHNPFTPKNHPVIFELRWLPNDHMIIVRVDDGLPQAVARSRYCVDEGIYDTALFIAVDYEKRICRILHRLYPGIDDASGEVLPLCKLPTPILEEILKLQP